jgi:hypothetical protein
MLKRVGLLSQILHAPPPSFELIGGEIGSLPTEQQFISSITKPPQTGTH